MAALLAMRHNLFATLALVSTISAPTFAGADLLLDGAEFQANTYTMFNQSGVPGRAVAGLVERERAQPGAALGAKELDL